MLGLTYCLRFSLGSMLGLVITFGLTSGSVFTSLDLTFGLTLSFACSPSSLSLRFSELNKLIFKLVQILKLGDDISILLL